MMMVQIFWGSVVLGLSTLIHIALVLSAVMLLVSMARHVARFALAIRLGFHLAVMLVAVVLAHTAQVWLWAFSFVWSGAVGNIGEAVYFSIVTYTTLGYGDVTLGDEFRLYAAMAAVTGLLNFGLSTAFVVGVLTKVLPARLTG